MPNLLIPTPIALTSTQVVSIHGLWNPVRFLCWKHVKESPAMTMGSLLAAGLTPHQLYCLQPDVEEWTSAHKVCMADVPRAVRWKLHPVDHLGANLFDVAGCKYPVDVLLALGMDYAYLRSRLGMLDEHMALMGLSTDQWYRMGMRAADVEWIRDDATCNRAFGVGRDVLRQELSREGGAPG